MLFLKGNDAALALGEPVQITMNSPTPDDVPQPPLPAIPEGGSYSGLLLDVEGRPQGLVVLSVSSGGAFTARVSSSGLVERVRGVLGGEAQEYALPSLGSLELAPNTTGNIDLTLGALSGIAVRVPFTVASPAPQRGAYRLVLTADPNQADGAKIPQRPGFGTVVVSSLGSVRCTGRTGDAAAFAFGSAVHGDGELPFYDRLYSRTRGRLGGSLVFRDGEMSDLEGSLWWTKPDRAFASARALPRLQAGGFTDAKVDGVGIRILKSRSSFHGQDWWGAVIRQRPAALPNYPVKE
jgi:hypothetical protein